MRSPQSLCFFYAILLRSVYWMMALSLVLHATNTYASTKEFRKLQQRSEQAELQNDLALAIQLNLQLLQLSSNDLDTLTTLSGLYGKAGNPGMQLTWALVALKGFPNHFAALINQGNALSSLGKNNAARQAFHKAQEIEPGSPIPMYSLGVLAQESGQDLEALHQFQEALKLSPNFEDAIFNLAVAYGNLKLYEEALKTLDHLIHQNPGASDARYLRAEIKEDFIKFKK